MIQITLRYSFPKSQSTRFDLFWTLTPYLGYWYHCDLCYLLLAYFGTESNCLRPHIDRSTLLVFAFVFLSFYLLLEIWYGPTVPCFLSPRCAASRVVCMYVDPNISSKSILLF